MTDTKTGDLVKRARGAVANDDRVVPPVDALVLQLADALEEAERDRDAALALVARYRRETPLGHQPHMIAHEADEMLARHATGQKGGDDDHE